MYVLVTFEPIMQRDERRVTGLSQVECRLIIKGVNVSSRQSRKRSFVNRGREGAGEEQGVVRSTIIKPEQINVTGMQR